MKANAAQARAAVEKPSPNTRFYLFHGPDEAGAADLAERLGKSLGDHVERIDLDMKALKEHPGRLADEASSMSLFGEARFIRVHGIEEGALEAVTLLLNAERTGNPVVAIGPNLKASGKLVKLAISLPEALAHACYIPEGIEASKLAVTIAREFGLRLAGDVAQHMARASGGDRAILTREIEKLALFLDACPESPKDADSTAIEAIGADLEDSDLGAAISAILDGRVAAVGTELAALGDNMGIPLMRQLARRLQALAEMRIDVDKGNSVDQVMEKHRVFFREKESVGRALRRWNAPQIARAIDRVRIAERAVMRSGSAGEIIASTECTAIARAAARARG